MLTQSVSRLVRGLSFSSLPLALCLSPIHAPAEQSHPCSQIANEVLKSCRLEANGDYWLQRAQCTNLPAGERAQCIADAVADLKQALKTCDAQFKARVKLCGKLGEAIYDPPVDPENFVAVIDNPYLPWLPGATYVYDSTNPQSPEHVEISVSKTPKLILGVACTEVHDVVFVDGQITEDTLDWYAQDLAGNVWYFGEHTMELENGLPVNLDGSWEAGVDGAKPGIAMEAHSTVGDLYRQEFKVHDAEDIAGVISLSASAAVPFGTFSQCIETEETTPIAPEALENKYYAAGIGLVLTVDVVTGDRSELVDFRLN